jgi:oligogalacturonide lyase
MLQSVAPAQIGKRYPSEKTIVNDTVTGVPMSVLTNGQANDAKIYQTHPQWAADGKYIIFRSSGRSPGRRRMR